MGRLWGRRGEGGGNDREGFFGRMVSGGVVGGKRLDVQFILGGNADRKELHGKMQ